jgi:hypothetical protein
MRFLHTNALHVDEPMQMPLDFTCSIHTREQSSVMVVVFSDYNASTTIGSLYIMLISMLIQAVKQ